MIPGMEGEPGGVFRGRSVTFIFRYALISEQLFSSELGHYRSFGIRAFQKTECGWREVAFVSDVSTDRAAVEQLARRCTEGQLDPIHLLDVVEDALGVPAFSVRRRVRAPGGSDAGEPGFSGAAASPWRPARAEAESARKNSTGGLPVKRGKLPMRQSAAERGRGRGARRTAQVGLAE